MIIPQSSFDALIATYHENCVAMIDNYFGVNCKLTFGTTKSVCINCNFNPITKKSSNTYKTGGPIVFDGSICPYCDGEGYTSLETTENIKLRVYPNRKNWLKIAIPATVKENSIQTIGHLRDMSKCRTAKYITANTDVSGHVVYNFQLAGEPIIHGLDKKFFIAFWNRFDG